MSSWYLGFERFFLANQALIVSSLLALQLAVLIVLIFIGASALKLRRLYNNLIQGVEKGNLESVMLRMGDRLQRAENDLNRLNSSLEELSLKSESYLQRWSLLRYKAFSNTGGDQSFSIALLDGKGNGVVLSSIYGRDESRVYAKSIREGQSTYALSSEEADVLRQALSLEL